MSKGLIFFAYDSRLDLLLKIFGDLFISRYLGNAVISTEINGKTFTIKFREGEVYQNRSLDIVCSDDRRVKISLEDYTKDRYNPYAIAVIKIFNKKNNMSVRFESEILRYGVLDKNNIDYFDYSNASSWQEFLSKKNLSDISFFRRGLVFCKYKGSEFTPDNYPIIIDKIKTYINNFTREELETLKKFIFSYVAGILEQSGIDVSGIKDPYHTSLPSHLDGPNPHNFSGRTLSRSDWDD